MARLEHPIDLDYAIEGVIGVLVKGDLWSCVALPGFVALIGTGKSVRVDAVVDEVAVSNMGLLPTGDGELMLSVSAALRKKLGKDVGDPVRVVVERRLT